MHDQNEEMHNITLKVSKQKYLWLRKALAILSEQVNCKLTVASYLNKSLDHKIDEFKSLYADRDLCARAEEDFRPLSAPSPDIRRQREGSAAWLQREFGVSSARH